MNFTRQITIASVGARKMGVVKAVAIGLVGWHVGFLVGAIEAFAEKSETARSEPYCLDLKRVAEVAATRDKFKSIVGQPRDGNFLETTLPLSGWKDCSIYGATTYTCDSRGLPTAQAAEQEQAKILRDIKACFGGSWTEPPDRSSPSYVVLHHIARPISITLSTDQTDRKEHLVRLILFVRRN